MPCRSFGILLWHFSVLTTWWEQVLYWLFFPSQNMVRTGPTGCFRTRNVVRIGPTDCFSYTEPSVNQFSCLLFFVHKTQWEPVLLIVFVHRKLCEPVLLIALCIQNMMWTGSTDYLMYALHGVNRFYCFCLWFHNLDLAVSRLLSSRLCFFSELWRPLAKKI